MTGTTATIAISETSQFSRENLLKSIQVFFEEQGLTYMALPDAGRYPTAFGLCLRTLSTGWGVELLAAPSSCGTGIVYEAKAIFNYGTGWERNDRMLLPAPRGLGETYEVGSTRWSTSELLKQFGQVRGCNPKFLTYIRESFEYTMEKERQARLRQESARKIIEQFKASPSGEFSGPGYSGVITPLPAAPNIALTVNTDNPDKIARILEIMAES
jgi:hypothetical protein